MSVSLAPHTRFNRRPPRSRRLSLEERQSRRPGRSTSREPSLCVVAIPVLVGARYPLLALPAV